MLPAPIIAVCHATSFAPSCVSASQQGAGALCAAGRVSDDDDDEDKDIMKIIDKIAKKALFGVREPLPSLPVDPVFHFTPSEGFAVVMGGISMLHVHILKAFLPRTSPSTAPRG